MAKILAVRLSSLGDIVLTQPVIAALAQAGHEVDLLVKPEYRDLAGLFPGVSHVLTSPAEVAGPYAWVLDWHGTGRARQWISGVRHAQVARYAKRALARRMLVRPWGHPVFWNDWSSLRGMQSVTDGYGQAARKAGLIETWKSPQLKIPLKAKQQAESLLRKAKLDPRKKWAVLAPGARWPTKQWPLENFIQLALGLKKLDCQSVWIGGQAESELCQSAAAQCGSQAASLAGKTDLGVLAALLAQADLLVTNDSGPLHLGVAAGTRVLAFFGPTVAEFGFMPKPSARVTVLEREMPCRPCAVHGSRSCPLGHHDCLKKILPEDALTACKILLKMRE